MAVKSEDFDGVCVLTLPAQFAGDEVAAARQSAADSVKFRQICDLVIDLSKTVHVDSLGLEALLWMKQQSIAQSGRLKLASVSDTVRTILDMTRLTPRFEIAYDVPAALKMLRRLN